MNIIPINEAKAIIETYYNNGEVIYPLHEHPVLSNYTFKIFSENIEIKATWCSLNIHIKKGDAKKKLVTMERDCDLNLSNYNQLNLFASVSKNVLIDVEAVIDGKKQILLQQVSGYDTTGELLIPFDGKIISHYKFSFSIKEDKDCNIDFRWLGVVNSEKEKLRQENKFIVDQTWPMCIKSEISEIQPEFGIYFNNEELKTIRENIEETPFRESFEKLRNIAKKYLSLDPDSAEIHIHTTIGEPIKKENMIPENMISKFVPWGDRRWNLDSEMEYSRIAKQMEVLAFVGLIDEDIDMCRMAARMALSIAYCENWTESAMGNLPGTTWHHRSFTEVAYLRACSIVLDWAGSILTPYGKDIILDAMIMKGLPRVESDFKRFEYIRHMNQGIHFNAGRIHAYTVLSKVWPRYEELMEQCNKDLFEMIDDYVLSDGGALEGPAYWNYTFSQAMQEVYMLSIYYKKELEDISSEKLIKTGDYGINMLSTLKNGTMLLPINDSHSEKTYHLGMTACFYLLSKNVQWKKLYFRMLETDEVEPDPFLFIISSKIKSEENSSHEMNEWFNVLKETGQVDLRVKNEENGLIHLHYSTGPVYFGHYHGDKGSLIIEADGESLLIDRGVTPYSHPETTNMKLTKNHNCLVPYDKNGVYYSQPQSQKGGVLETATYDKRLTICSDDTKAWEDGVFTKCSRLVTSEKYNEYLITDIGEVSNKVKGVSFRLHTHKSVIKDKDGYTIVGDKNILKIIPINYSLENSGCKRDGIDGEMRDVNLIWINQEIEKNYNLQTKLIIIKK